MLLEVKGVNEPFAGMYKLKVLNLTDSPTLMKNRDVIERNYIKVTNPEAVRILYGE